jgi:hypothetical protein
MTRHAICDIGFSDYQSDPDLLRDPDGWCDREIARYFAERRARE